MFGRIKIRKSDQLFSQYIRRRAKWKCERCGRQYQKGDRGLHCSHFYGRAKESVRRDPENASAHCMGCHAYFTANPEEHRAWKLKQMGERAYKLLMVRANGYQKKDEKLAILYCKKLLSELDTTIA